jgi:ATP-dependent DNA helicase DinG
MPNPKLDRDFLRKVTGILSAEGPLRSILTGFAEREEQVEMARVITHAFYHNEIATVQAGTGVGKSFAYLIPALLWAEEYEETVVISTATTNLQDQLRQKDIPVLRSILDFDFEAVVVKGAQQYICLDRLEEQSGSLPLSFSMKERDQMSAIRSWAFESESGQRSELPFEPSPRLWREIEVATTMCLYDSCRFFNECAFIRDRRRIPRAHIIITNHSLLMSDCILKTQSEGYASILPEYTRLIVDEAHKFESAVTDSLSVTLNPINTHALLSRIYSPDAGDGFLNILRSQVKFLPTGRGERTAYSRALTKSEQTVGNALQCMSNLFDRLMPVAYNSVIPNSNYTVKQPYTNDWLQTPELTDIRDNELDTFCSLTERLENELYAFQLRFSKLEENEELLRLRKHIQFYREQIRQLNRGLKILFDDEEDDDVRWIELPPQGNTLSFRSAPLSVDDFLGPFLFEQMKTVVFTSATLAPGNAFDYFLSSIGLDSIETHRQTTTLLSSPFPYERNALLLVPTNVPDPTVPSFQTAICEIIPRAIAASNGRALVLFTSHSMLQKTYAETRGDIEALGYDCYSQGELSRAVALEKFRDEVHSVLFGTTSFWDGIDVSGESLSLVVIVRLPFSVPNDPIVDARSQHIADEGKNAFMEYHLPNAAMRLQQGVGRLIRSNTDRGVILCLDKRLITKQYGTYIRNSLPPCSFHTGPIDEVIDEIGSFLANE